MQGGIKMFNNDTNPFRVFNFKASIINTNDDDKRELVEGFQIQKFEKQAWDTFIITYIPLYADGDILYLLERNIGNMFNIVYTLLGSDSQVVSEHVYKTCFVDYEICSDYSSDSALLIKLYFDGSKELNEPIAAAGFDCLGFDPIAKGK